LHASGRLKKEKAPPGGRAVSGIKEGMLSLSDGD